MQAEGLVRNVGQFARFLEAVSFSHGSALNMSNVAREAQAKPKTVAGFVEILEDLLAFRVPVFTRRARRKTESHPKCLTPACSARCFWAIEVKNSDRVRPADLRGLRAFSEDYPECRPLLLYRGVDPLRKGDVRCFPVYEFLAALRPGRQIDEG